MSGTRPVDDIVDLAARLIRLPTQGGIDPAGPALSEMAGWLAGAGLAPELLADADGRPIAVVATVEGARPGPAWCLDACIDTAPVGDRAAWTVDPFGGTVAHGRLWGRGAADCRIAVASFAHLAAALATERERMAGSLRLLFDADEHTGRFGGVRAFAERYPDTAGVFIGYPENHQINLGARGFWRARIAVFGEAAHSGAAGPAGTNAAIRAAALVRDLAALGLPEADPAADFPLPPKATVTSIEGGSGFSVVPDRVTVGLDIRLTPTFDAGAAADAVAEAVRRLDAEGPVPRPSVVDPVDSWPAYRLDEDHPLVAALAAGAEAGFGRAVPARVCGPSNIGNYLAGRGIPATCGFGVGCGGVHGADEWVDLATVGPTYRAYETAMRRLLGMA